MGEFSAVGLNPNGHLQLIDHLAPICLIMKMPLLLTDEMLAERVKRLYPGIEIHLMDWLDFNPRYLIENFDVFFQSEPWSRKQFYHIFAPLEQMYGKEVRNVFCPHGFSDKIFWFEKCANEDITLIYGQSTLDFFEWTGLKEQVNCAVRTGNYRHLYYRQNQSFYDKIALEDVLGRLPANRTNILYAPTCMDPDFNTSVLSSSPLFDHLPDSYNLLVKLHPVLDETDAPKLYELIGKYEKKPNVLFIKDWPPVFPLLSWADIYLGDMSSIGYDFLAFNRPMFFLNQRLRNPQTDRNAYLFRCGHVILPHQYAHFYNILDKELPTDKERFSTIRAQTYDYAFGEEIPFETLKHSIEQAYTSTRKDV